MKIQVYLLSSRNECITGDFYISQNNYLNYYSLQDDRWFSRLIYNQDIQSGWEYDTETNNCYLSKQVLINSNETMSSLGMTQANYNFLMGLSGILIGFVLLLGFVLHFTRR